MASIVGVERYVGRCLEDEKRCLTEIRQFILAAAALTSVPPHIEEKLMKLRNCSREVGSMKRLAADLRKEKGW